MATNNIKLVRCRCCLHASLIQYGVNDPVLAECHKKPDMYNARFPFTVEVANVLRQCPMHEYQNETEKAIQLRVKRNLWTGMVIHDQKNSEDEGEKAA